MHQNRSRSESMYRTFPSCDQAGMKSLSGLPLIAIIDETLCTVPASGRAIRIRPPPDGLRALSAIHSFDGENRAPSKSQSGSRKSVVFLPESTSNKPMVDGAPL